MVFVRARGNSIWNSIKPSSEQSQKSEKYFELEPFQGTALHKGQKSQQFYMCDFLSGIKSGSILYIGQQSQRCERHFQRELSMDTAIHEGWKSQQCQKSKECDYILQYPENLVESHRTTQNILEFQKKPSRMFFNLRECCRIFLRPFTLSESYRTFWNSIKPSSEMSQKSEKHFECKPSLGTAI